MMHTIMNEEKQQRVDEIVSDLMVALSHELQMSLPATVYMVQQITCRHLNTWDNQATIKILRLTARYFNKDIQYRDFSKDQAKMFDRITAGYERVQGVGVN